MNHLEIMSIHNPVIVGITMAEGVVVMVTAEEDEVVEGIMMMGIIIIMIDIMTTIVVGADIIGDITITGMSIITMMMGMSGVVITIVEEVEEEVDIIEITTTIMDTNTMMTIETVTGDVVGTTIGAEEGEDITGIMMMVVMQII